MHPLSSQSSSSPVVKYTPATSDIDSVIDSYAIFQQSDLALPELPDYLWPAKGKYGLKDYEKVFHATQDDNIYDLRSIDKDKGCIVIVRPDQHIAALLPLTAHDELSAFFDVFMRVPSLP